MVDRMDAVAELGDVPDRLLDEDVLVAHEDDPDDLRSLPLLERPLEQRAGRRPATAR